MNTGKPYEDKFRQIVTGSPADFGLTSVAEAKQDYQGEDTTWNIDVSGFTGDRLVAFECRDRKRPPIKEEVGGFANRLRDLNATGYIVSPKPLSEGGQEVARGRGIGHIPFVYSANTGDFILRHENKAFAGVHAGAKFGATVSVIVEKVSGKS